MAALKAAAMALSAEPCLNQLIWLSLKVWFTGKVYVEPSVRLPCTRQQQWDIRHE